MSLSINLLSGKENLSVDQAKAQLKFNEWMENNEDYIILDTETTGIYDCEIVEVAVINLDGDVLFNSLVKPKNEIPLEATQIHQITNEMVKDHPTWPNIWEKLYPIIKDKKILIYNDSFDIRAMKERFDPYPTDEEDPFEDCTQIKQINKLQTECVMRTYADLAGFDRWVKLAYACGYKTSHRALGDCKATLTVIKNSYRPDFTELDCYRISIYQEYRWIEKEINRITLQLERLAKEQHQLLEKNKKNLVLLLDENILKEHISIEEAAVTLDDQKPYNKYTKPVDLSDDDLPF